MTRYLPTNYYSPNVMTKYESGWGNIPTIIQDLIIQFGLKTNKAIEFGVEFGYSISALANYFDSVIGVDTFEGDRHSGKKANHYEETKNDLQGYSNITLIKSDYKDFIKTNNDTYDLIHIDIVHTYQDTYACGEWSVNHSDFVIFHDTMVRGVRNVCNDLSNEYGFVFYNYGDSNGLGILKKIV